jgi:uncharacterized protein
MNDAVIFHLAFPIGNIPETKAFYVDGLGCAVGRESQTAIILNLYGTQLVGHLSQQSFKPQRGIYPRHFGVVFSQGSDFQALLDRAIVKSLVFYQSEKRRFPNTPLEHRTFFLEDPFYNLLEFKYYVNANAIFGETETAQIGDSRS